MPRRAVPNLPPTTTTSNSAGAISWLDLYPPPPPPPSTIFPSTSPAPPPPPPQPSRPKPPPNPKLLTRITTLRTALSSIHETISHRTHLLNLHKHENLYCPTCTPASHPSGTCCPKTCPLLRPPEKAYSLPLTAGWLARVNADSRTYEDLVADMDVRGDYSGVRAATVSRWERTVEQLRVNGRSVAEGEAEGGWRLFRTVNERKAGLKQGWGFDGAWGKGLREAVMEEEEVAPEEMVEEGVKEREKKRVKRA